MKDWLVDVPVKVNIWIRPECQKKQFEIIKKARPSILFVISDGGRNENEWQLIYKNRKLFDEEIDWNCQIYKLYEDKNQGMYAMGRKLHEFVWSRVDRCIFLEDDILPSVSFFKYCAVLLEKYKNDLRVNVICGMNHLGISKNVSSDYFFSRQGSIWGIAMWKRTWQQYYDFSYAKDPYVMKCLKQRMQNNKWMWTKTTAYANSEYFDGHVAGDEFFLEFSMYAQNQLQIIPKYNLVSNIGCTGDAAHTSELRELPRGLRRVFNAKTYEIEFPMVEAKFVFPDVEYEKKRNNIMAYNRPDIDFMRKIERFFLCIRYQGISYAINKVKRTVIKEREK